VGIDRRILMFFASHRDPAATWLARAVMAGGTNPVVWGLAAVVGAVLVVRARQWRLGFAGAASLLVADLAANLLKLAFTRPRPPLDLSLVRLHGWSMPSTQAALTAALAVAVFLAADWSSRPDGPRLRRLAARLLPAAVVLVGVCMVYLGGHWTSDVLAGWALGVVVGLTSAGTARAVPLPRRAARAASRTD